MPDKYSTWSRLRGMEPLSLCDWPGRLSAVLFLGGCDLRCPTCHNSVLAWTPERLDRLAADKVQRFLETGASWLDGLVITGGEAALSSDLPEWLAELRSRFALPIKLDTNGMHPEVVEESLRQKVVDLVAVDVKGPLEKYPLLTGGRTDITHAAARLAQMFDLAVAFPERFVFRCTAVPVLDREDLARVRSMLPSGFSLITQPFTHPRSHNQKEGRLC